MNVYDFDGTIYAGDSTLDFYKYCLKKRPALITLWPKQILGAIAYKLKIISKTRFKEIFFCFFKKIDMDVMVPAFWDTHEKKIKDWYLENKTATDVIISASPDCLLKHICAKLNVHLICSNVNRKTGAFYGENCYGEEKVRRFYERFGENEVIDHFYTDSLSDYPLANISEQSFYLKKEAIVPWDIFAAKNERTDIFDKIMGMRVFQNIFPLYQKYKEVLLYLFFGGLTFLIGTVSYLIITGCFLIRPTVANIISWIIAVLFAFVTNRKWVFESSHSRKSYLPFIKFVIARVLTLVIEEAILWLFIEKMSFSNLWVKIAAQIVVIILNYILSKLWVFKRGHKDHV